MASTRSLSIGLGRCKTQNVYKYALLWVEKWQDAKQQAGCGLLLLKRHYC